MPVHEPHKKWLLINCQLVRNILALKFSLVMIESFVIRYSLRPSKNCVTKLLLQSLRLRAKKSSVIEKVLDVQVTSVSLKRYQLHLTWGPEHQLPLSTRLPLLYTLTHLSPVSS